MYNPIDLAFVAVMIYGFYKGAAQGFIGGVLNFMKFALGIYLALRFGSALSAIAKSTAHQSYLYANTRFYCHACRRYGRIVHFRVGIRHICQDSTIRTR